MSKLFFVLGLAHRGKVDNIIFGSKCVAIARNELRIND